MEHELISNSVANDDVLYDDGGGDDRPSDDSHDPGDLFYDGERYETSRVGDNSAGPWIC